MRLLSLTFGAVLWAAPSLAERIETAAAIPAGDVILLGEVHDNPAHHAFQAEALAAIAPTAVIWEMLPPGTEIDTSLSPEDLGASLDWEARGWPDFALYAPLFAAAPDAVHLGMALPREDVRRAMGEGAAAVFGERAGRFRLGEPLPPRQQGEREAGQMRDHCDALPEEMLAGFVEAQRLRDAGFARTVLAALEAHGPPVAVIAGTGHVRKDWGIPAMIRIAAPGTSVVSVGQLESEPGAERPPFDVWTVAAAPERGDPCEAFR